MMGVNLRMGLRHKFILYLVFIHLLFAAIAAYLLIHHRILLVAVEAVFIVSVYIGIRLIRGLFVPLDMIRTGAELMEEGDFSSRFRETGHPEMDRLVEVYNRMADHLRNERIRLQEQNYFLDKILAVSPTGVLALDFEGKISMANPAAERMLRAGETDLIGCDLGRLQPPFVDTLTSLRAGESEIVPLFGRRRVKCHRAQFFDRGFTRDFILMEELTEELRQTEKTAYEKIIRMMSHEVNNSIGSANSLLHSCLHYAGQLHDNDRGDFENALKVIIARTDYVNTFMRNFADVFRLPKPSLKPADVKVLLEETAVLFKNELISRNIELKWDLQQQSETVPMDRSQMNQVFTNILKNAIEAIERDGTITLRLGRRNGNPYAVVEDTGSGISPALRSDLFTPFFSTKENGQGIGLTLVQEILDAHGFEFSLEGESGQPTRFTIVFTI